MKITETEKLDLLLNGRGLKLCGFTRSDGDATQEELAREIRKAIIAVQRGEGRDIDLLI